MISDDGSSGQCWRYKAPKDLNWAFCSACGARLKETKSPSSPDPARDILFLYDLYSFGWYNHHIGAIALYEAAAAINNIYSPRIPEDYPLIIESAQVQKILRTKIFTELMALLETFGVLCLAIAKHKKQGVLWTYLHTDPQEVTQFYDRVLSFNSPASLQRLLNLPSPSIVTKAIASGSYISIAGLPDNVSQIDIKDVIYDYKSYGESIVQVAKTYREQDSVNVRLYNKIKHVFPIIQGHWLNPPLDSQHTAIILDDKLTIVRLPMEQIEIDRELNNIRIVMDSGAELMALFINLYRLGVL